MKSPGAAHLKLTLPPEQPESPLSSSQFPGDFPCLSLTHALDSLVPDKLIGLSNLDFSSLLVAMDVLVTRANLETLLPVFGFLPQFFI